jgi:hypothetical protein
VFCLSQKSCGHENIELSYKDFKDAWYGFLALLDINYSEGSICKVCGIVPNVIVCDATSLGHQKKFSTLALQEKPSKTYIRKFSYVFR